MTNTESSSVKTTEDRLDETCAKRLGLEGPKNICAGGFRNHCDGTEVEREIIPYHQRAMALAEADGKCTCYARTYMDCCGRIAHTPSITTDWAVFGKALERVDSVAQRADITSAVGDSREWLVTLWYADTHCARGKSPDPRVALARAIAAMPGEAFEKMDGSS